MMGTVRATFTLDRERAEQARRLKVNISAAAREGVAVSVRKALAEADRLAYLRRLEQPDDFWEQAQAYASGC